MSCPLTFIVQSRSHGQVQHQWGRELHSIRDGSGMKDLLNDYPDYHRDLGPLPTHL